MIKGFKMEDEIMVDQALKDSRNWWVAVIVNFLRGRMVQNLLILIVTVAMEHYGHVQAHWILIFQWVNCMVYELELNKTVKNLTECLNIY